MDKKTAEDEAMKKAKETQAAAGKNSGMSGRDLVRSLIHLTLYSSCTSLTTHIVYVQPRVVRRRRGGGR